MLPDLVLTSTTPKVRTLPEEGANTVTCGRCGRVFVATKNSEGVLEATGAYLHMVACGRAMGGGLRVGRCPVCGKVPRGTVEVVKGCAELAEIVPGVFEHSGNTEIWWDEQKTEKDEQGRTHFICEDGHEWFEDAELKGETQIAQDRRAAVGAGRA